MMFALQLLLSTLTIWFVVSAGNKRRQAWMIALVNQGFWFLYIWLTKSWGLLLMGLVLTCVYARNLWLWRGPTLTIEPWLLFGKKTFGTPPADWDPDAPMTEEETAALDGYRKADYAENQARILPLPIPLPSPVLLEKVLFEASPKGRVKIERPTTPRHLIHCPKCKFCPKDLSGNEFCRRKRKTGPIYLHRLCARHKKAHA